MPVRATMPEVGASDCASRPWHSSETETATTVHSLRIISILFRRLVATVRGEPVRYSVGVRPDGGLAHRLEKRRRGGRIEGAKVLADQLRQRRGDLRLSNCR